MITPELYLLVAAFLLANLLIGLIPVVARAGRANRLLAAQMLSTTITAILLLLAEALALPALRDVALIFALLGVLIGAAFARFTPAASGKSDS